VSAVAHIDTPRLPPQSIESEQSVLGGLMLAPESLTRIADWLTEDDFYRRDHRLIYRAIRELAERRKPFDSVTLGEWFEVNGLTDQIGSSSYLIDLASTTPSAANLVAYAEIVQEKARLRRCIEVGTALVNDAFNPAGRSCADVIAPSVQALSEMRGFGRAGGLQPASGGLKDWFDDLQARFEHGDRMTGIPYPWHDVNDITHGLQPGELTVIAGRPSMGKSVMGLNLAVFCALRGINTAFFSLEMTTRQVNRRNVATIGEVDHDWLLAPDPEHDEYWPRVTIALQKLKHAPLLVDDAGGLKIEQIVARARRAHLQKPIGLLVLDHLHEVAIPGDTPRIEYGRAVGAMKDLGKEFGCPVVVLSQLNRGVEGQGDKRPSMKDLRESGEIEQKADVIWFLYREDYYRRNDPNYQPQGDVELILGKGRDLKTGKPVILRERFDQMRLADWEGAKPFRNEAKPSRGLS
jgi:replicative DNA helicase